MYVASPESIISLEATSCEQHMITVDGGEVAVLSHFGSHNPSFAVQNQRTGISS